MSRAVVFAPEAASDLEDATGYYELQQPGLGRQFLRAIDAPVARLDRHPEIAAVDAKGVRTAFVHRFPYAIRFRVRDDRIEVVAVWHERRDPAGWSDRVRELATPWRSRGFASAA